MNPDPACAKTTVAEALKQLPGPDGKRQYFGPTDVLFAAAGVEHRFENFSEDLVVWVMFYGPEGGETD